MFCGNCGHHIPDTNNFCTKCGSPVSKNFNVAEEKGIFVVTARVENIDYTNHGELSSIFARVLKKRIMIDLAKVTFIDSTGIGTLVTMYYKTVRTKQEIKIVNVHENVMKAIKSLSVDNVLDIRGSKEEAFGDWGLAML